MKINNTNLEIMDIIDKLEKQMKVESLRYLITKHVFCPYSGSVLDIDNAIMIDALNETTGDLVSTHVIHGKFKSKINEIKQVAKVKGLELDIFINIKK
jgi:hypothetical protein